MSSLAQRIAEARRQEEESTRVEQEESETQASAAKKEEEFEELSDRLGSAFGEFRGIVKLVFQTNDDGTKAPDFDLDKFEPAHAEELIVAFEQMLDGITGEPKTRRLLSLKRDKSTERKPRDLKKAGTWLKSKANQLP